jgi:hypothetical protein
MKKLLGILVLGLLLSGNAYAEKIIFSDCASKKDNFIFNPKIWEKNEIIIDTSKKTVSRILIKSDEFLKTEKDAEKYFIFGPDKLDAIIEGYAVRELYLDGELKVKKTYDLEKKTYESIDLQNNTKYINKCK